MPVRLLLARLAAVELPAQLRKGGPPALVVGALALLWGVLFVALPPAQQDFPLSDAWAYAKGLFALLRGEGLHYYRQPSMPLLGQWLWASPFVWFLGESHVALRLSTIVLSGVGVLAFYDLLRQELDLPPGEAAFATATFALNPLVFLLTGTFMSDVPGLALSLVALAFYGRAVRSERKGLLAAGMLAAILAALTRQNTLTAPLAAAILLVRQRPLRVQPLWWLGVCLPLAVGIAVHVWFNARPDAVPYPPELPALRRVLILTFAAVHTCGLAVLPITLVHRLQGRWLGVSLAFLLMLHGVALCALHAEFFPYGGAYPYVHNMLTPWGVFEVNTLVAGQRPMLMGEATRWALTLAGCWGGAVLLFNLPDWWASSSRPRLLPTFTLLHFLLLLVSPTLFDRYLIVLLPGAVALAAAHKGTTIRRWWAGLTVLAVLGGLSAGLMHDWLAWNSARWTVGRRAMAHGIAASDIEGGFEWDSWFAPMDVAREGPWLPPRGRMLPFNRQRFPHLTGRYALAFSVPGGTLVRDAEPYALWLIPGHYHFYLVERRPEGEP